MQFEFEKTTSYDYYVGKLAETIIVMQLKYCKYSWMNKAWGIWYFH